MARCPIVVVCPDNSTYRITAKQARDIVADGLGEDAGKGMIRLKPQGRPGGRLSQVVGAALASAALRGESWARVAVAETRRRTS